LSITIPITKSNFHYYNDFKFIIHCNIPPSANALPFLECSNYVLSDEICNQICYYISLYFHGTLFLGKIWFPVCTACEFKTDVGIDFMI
jgi:hypothetical protein